MEIQAAVSYDFRSVKYNEPSIVAFDFCSGSLIEIGTTFFFILNNTFQRYLLYR